MSFIDTRGLDFARLTPVVETTTTTPALPWVIECPPAAGPAVIDEVRASVEGSLRDERPVFLPDGFRLVYPGTGVAGELAEAVTDSGWQRWIVFSFWACILTMWACILILGTRS